MTEDQRPAEDRPVAQSSLAANSGWFVARLLSGNIDGLCVVSDLTAVDAKIVAATPLAVDQRITLDLGQGLNISGEVRWIDPTRCGLEF
ncbi:MAG TPA: hypothetical protein VI199_12200, partial [Novosphingobium sp.]